MKFAAQTAADMAIAVSAFSRNVADLFSIREKMAKRIEQLVKK